MSGKKISPDNISGKETLEYLIDNTFLAYNSARLKEACRLFKYKMLGKNVTVGLALSGALTPAGIGASCIVPLINAGFVDWIVTTGANMYHDLHFAFDCPPRVGRVNVDDADLRKNDVVRIYDIFLGFSESLYTTDKIIQRIMLQPDFQAEMGTQQFHFFLGKYVNEFEFRNGLKNISVLAAAYRNKVPVFSSAPGDSSIGMDMAALELWGNKLKINPSIDVIESAAIVLDTKRSNGKSAVILMGGGTPKNFILQTEPFIQEILKMKEFGHDYFIQVTDARPDTGGLSGATPNEAVSWGKLDPDNISDSVVCYTDASIALPLISHYGLSKHKKRPLKRLYSKREQMVEKLKTEYFSHNKISPVNLKDL